MEDKKILAEAKTQIKQRVLVVEDHLLSNESYVDFFKGKGFEADGATTYQEAIELLKNHKYDIVIMDYNLGGRQTGLDILKEVPALVKTAKVYANSADYGYSSDLLEAGCCGSLNKDYTTLHEMFERK